MRHNRPHSHEYHRNDTTVTAEGHQTHGQQNTGIQGAGDTRTALESGRHGERHAPDGQVEHLPRADSLLRARRGTLLHRRARGAELRAVPRRRTVSS